MDRIEANSLQALFGALSRIRAVVPQRGFKRLSEHTEPWITQRLIAALASAKLVNFPLTIELADRPDVVIESGGQEIGIELMELVPRAYAEALAIANREFPSANVDRSVFRWEVDWTSSAIRDHLRREGHRLSGDGWAGDAVEYEWAAAVRDAIDRKTERLNANGFKHYSENWLGTYASAPGPAFDVEIGSGLLTPEDLLRSTFARNFDAVANLVGDHVVVVQKSGVTVCPCVSIESDDR